MHLVFIYVSVKMCVFALAVIHFDALQLANNSSTVSISASKLIAAASCACHKLSCPLHTHTN